MVPRPRARAHEREEHAIAAQTLTGSAAAALGNLHQNGRSLNGRGDLGAVRCHVDVDLRAHAKRRQIDPGLDRKSSTGEDRPRVVRLEIVQIGSQAVQGAIATEGMSRSVDEVLTESGADDVLTRNVIEFEAAERLHPTEAALQSL